MKLPILFFTSEMETITKSTLVEPSGLVIVPTLLLYGSLCVGTGFIADFGYARSLLLR
jgi:hypothetical protein